MSALAGRHRLPCPALRNGTPAPVLAGPNLIRALFSPDHSSAAEKRPSLKSLQLNPGVVA